MALFHEIWTFNFHCHRDWMLPMSHSVSHLTIVLITSCMRIIRSISVCIPLFLYFSHKLWIYTFFVFLYGFNVYHNLWITIRSNVNLYIYSKDITKYSAYIDPCIHEKVFNSYCVYSTILRAVTLLKQIARASRDSRATGFLGLYLI